MNEESTILPDNPAEIEKVYLATKSEITQLKNRVVKVLETTPRLYKIHKGQLDDDGFEWLKEQCFQAGVLLNVGPKESLDIGHLYDLPEGILSPSEELALKGVSDLRRRIHEKSNDLNEIATQAAIYGVELPKEDEKKTVESKAVESEKKKETKPGKKRGRPPDENAERRRELIFNELRVDTITEAASLLGNTLWRHKLYEKLDEKCVGFLKSRRYKSTCWKEVPDNLEDEEVKETLIRDLRKHWDHLKTLHQTD